MTGPRRDADSALRKVEKRPAGGPLGGGQDSPSAYERPHGPTDPLPAPGRPQPEPHREPAPEGRFSARRPIRLRATRYGETSPKPWRRRGRRGADVDSPPFSPPLAAVDIVASHGSTRFNTVSTVQRNGATQDLGAVWFEAGLAAGPGQARGAMRTARCACAPTFHRSPWRRWEPWRMADSTRSRVTTPSRGAEASL